MLTSNEYGNLGGTTDPALPGINTTYESSQPTPMLTGTQTWWDEIKELGSDAAELSGRIGQGMQQAVSEGYEVVSGGVGRVVKDASQGIAGATTTIAAPVEGILSFGVFQIILIVGVLGAALYYTGKSGGLRVSV